MANILIVDDDSAVQITIRLLLEMAGHNMMVAGDGHRGLQKQALLATVDDCLQASKPRTSDVSTGGR
ncbi:hypothetical protein QA640_02210 [Bradyrhizobium sp. CB82]|uniref:hypothetical protein n=1 Tax=Bradyrhizobium sp. CB82 TaxID=3039159 RepID=UPI0024B27DC4|nr:hypothetical protein [Bradyrhizobium sp. CB82]WFU41370.1 hypothetical protein QA640_02210 [Bradyrhizobium sp. CB82]